MYTKTKKKYITITVIHLEYAASDNTEIKSLQRIYTTHKRQIESSDVRLNARKLKKIFKLVSIIIFLSK